jgi:hypothetical protein
MYNTSFDKAMNLLTDNQLLLIPKKIYLVCFLRTNVNFSEIKVLITENIYQDQDQDQVI